MHLSTIIKVVLIVAASLLTVGCRCSGDDKNISEGAEVDTTNVIFKYEGSLFPIPSSWETAKMLKEFNIPFNKHLLNSPDNAPRYTTSFKQALNLGVWSADLSYLNIHDEYQRSLLYLSSIKKICIELGIYQIFGDETFSAIEVKLKNKDSLTRIMTNAYTQSDTYLKANDRGDIGSLIIAGAWIESMHMLTKLACETQNREIINRIGEQKYPLANLIELLTPFYYKSEEFALFVNDLIDISHEFDGIIYNYTYKAPQVFPEDKLIIINSQSKIVISEYHLQIISKKVECLRNKMVE